MLRRCCDTLSTSGAAIIAFSFWDLAKALLSSIYGSSAPVENEALAQRLQSIIEAMGDRRNALLIVLVFALLLLTQLALVLRFYVGLSARAEARGKQKGWAYVVLAEIMASMSAVLMIAGVLLSQSASSAVGLIVTGAIELTSLFAYIDLIRSAIMVKRLRRARQRAGR